MRTVNIRLNGQPVSQTVDDRLSLADFVRDRCLLTGTPYRLRAWRLRRLHGDDGRQAVRSCITLAAAADGSDVRTVEGYQGDALMDAIRKAFNLRHALQCGFCTPGMLATAYDIALAHRRSRPRPHSRRVGRQSLPLHRVSSIIQAIEDVRHNSSGQRGIAS